MTLSISNTTISRQFFPTNITQPSVSLISIRNANGNILQIVKLLNENKERCLELFRKAVEEEDSIAQIQLSQAYFEIKWREEEGKNSVYSQNEGFDPFCYYPREFDLFIETYREAMKTEDNYQLEQEIAEKTFRKAANKGYLPAFLELTHRIWGNYTKSYGFAMQLQPFVNKGDKVIDYYFGKGLKHGSKPGSKLFYEGLYWMYKSKGIPVQFPAEKEPFDNFISRYSRSSEGRWYSYYDQDGFTYVNEGSTILAPSREEWEAFVKEKLETVETATKEFYIFPYDEKKILSVLTKDIGTANCETFEVSATGQDIANDYERKIRGFRIHSVSIYDSGERKGTISVQKNTSSDSKYPFEIYKTFQDKQLQPIIDLIENIMIRTGSTCSAESYVGYLKDRQYFSSSLSVATLGKA